MPILAVQNRKLIITNEDKSRGIAVEYPQDMGLGELLDKTEELRQLILKSIEQESKKEEKIEEVKPE